jgi:uncharacterized protein (DUF2235 family)
MKNIAIFCDGTWQHIDQPHPTNVANLARASLSTSPLGQTQTVYYDDGVGVGQGVLDAATHLIGGALGQGLDYKIVRAYEHLVLNYELDDRVFVFGFSRGAYTARSLVGLVRWAGILKRENAGRVFEAMSLYRSRPSKDSGPEAEQAFRAQARAFRDQYSIHSDAFTENKAYDPNDPASLTPGSHCSWIQYVGVWDTVGSLGIPSNFLLSDLIDEKYHFYDTSLSQFVRSARHAVSIDERRKTFEPSLWDNIDALNTNANAAGLEHTLRPYQQSWFPGGHGAVGGGEADGGISLAPMLWVAEGAARAGFGFDRTQLDHYASLAHPEAQFVKGGMNLGEYILETIGTADRQGPGSFDEASLPARMRWALVPSYRPVPLKRLAAVEQGLDRWQAPAGKPAYFDP